MHLTIINKRKLIIVGTILVLVVLIGIIVFSFLTAKEEREKQILQSAEELDQLQKVADEYDKDYAKIYDFVFSHVIDPEDEEITILIPMLLSVISHNHLHTEEHVHNGKEDLVAALGSQFVSAVKNNDVEQFLGVFEVYAYMEYMNGFSTPLDKESAVPNLMKLISREGLLEAAGILKDNEKNSINLVLKYSDGEEFKLKLRYRILVDNHYNHKEKVYTVTTTFEELSEIFEDLNK